MNNKSKHIKTTVGIQNENNLIQNHILLFASNSK